MHPLLSLTLALLLPVLAQSQPATSQPSTDRPDARYYRYTNLAARAIYGNDFERAATYYDSAFAGTRWPFYADLRKYVLLNYKRKRFDKNEAVLRILLSEKHIDTARLFYVLPRHVFSTANLATIEQLQKANRRGPRVYKELALKLRELIELDQEALNYKSKRSKTATDSLKLDTGRRFLALCRESGFPTEEQTGVFYPDGRTWETALYLLCNNLLQTPVREDLLFILEQAWRTGRLHAAYYAFLLEHVDENSPARNPDYAFLHSIAFVDGKPYRPLVYYSDSLLQLVERNRQRLGLDSVHIVQKQAVCDYYGKKRGMTITMAPFVSLQSLPGAWVRAAFAREKQALEAYRIDVEAVMRECRCGEKRI